MGNEHPILFTGEMVRAILDGRKTQTRRVIKPQPYPSKAGPDLWGVKTKRSKKAMSLINATVADVRYFCERWCPYGIAEDHLWVRETCYAQELESGLDGVRYCADNAFIPIENSQEAADRWGDLYAYRQQVGATVPSIHMPRWVSRIKLGVVRVRAERVQGISEKDVLAEGFPWRGIGAELQWGYRPPLVWFQALWDRINAKRGYGWDVNPWVWAVEFEVEQ